MSNSNNSQLDQSNEFANPFKLNDLPKFQHLPLKEYYGKQMFDLIQEGLREIAVKRYLCALM